MKMKTYDDALKAIKGYLDANDYEKIVDVQNGLIVTRINVATSEDIVNLLSANIPKYICHSKEVYRVEDVEKLLMLCKFNMK